MAKYVYTPKVKLANGSLQNAYISKSSIDGDFLEKINTIVALSNTAMLDALTTGGYADGQLATPTDDDGYVQGHIYQFSVSGGVYDWTDVTPTATNTGAGIIRIATDAEASTGTSQTIAVNPKQLNTAVSNLVTQTDLQQGLATKMTIGSVSASASGTSTNEVGYLTIEGNEYKLAGGGGSTITVTSTTVSDGTNTLDISTKMDSANAVGTGTFSIGRKTGTTVGANSVAIGAGDLTVSGSQAFACNYNNTASGQNSFACGNITRASGQGSFASGENSVASGQASHAEGYSSTAGSNSAHAEGCFTNASGAYSHTEGKYTTASGYNSHAEGLYTTANTQSQSVSGEYNVLDTTGSATTRGTYVEIVGNGTANNARSNARTLDWSGNEYLAGNLQASGLTDGTTTKTMTEILAGGGSSITVEDNLTSTSTTNALSANQGRVLKAAIDGKPYATAYEDISTMVTAVNAMSNTDLVVAWDIYLQTLNVPDLWVRSIEETSVPYTYTTDADFVSELETNGYVQVGYYKLAMLETKQVDLTNYVTTNTTQTISAAKTFGSSVFLNNNIYMYGRNTQGVGKILCGYTSSNNIVLGDTSLTSSQFIGTNMSIRPSSSAKDLIDLGSSGNKWRNLYLSGNLSDGTTTRTIGQIVGNTPATFTLSGTTLTITTL